MTTRKRSFTSSDEPHEVLGIRSNSTAEEVTSTYRKLAKTLHPDLAGADATEQFQILTEARDRMLKSLERNNMPPPSRPRPNPFTTFSETFAGSSGYHQFSRNNFIPTRRKPTPVVAAVLCTLEEIVAGCSRVVKFSRSVGVNEMGIKTETAQITVTIPPGTSEGQSITVHGVGDKYHGMEAGDLSCLVRYASHEIWKPCKGASQVGCVEHTCVIDISELLLGFSVRIMTLGETEPRFVEFLPPLNVTVPFVLPHCGLPISPGGQARGHAFIYLSIAPLNACITREGDAEKLREILRNMTPAPALASAPKKR